MSISNKISSGIKPYPVLVKDGDKIFRQACSKVNGLSEYEKVIRDKDISGVAFLMLSELQINTWRSQLSVQQIRKLWSFITNLKTNPEQVRFHIASGRPKPKIFEPPLKCKYNTATTLPKSTAQKPLNTNTYRKCFEKSQSNAGKQWSVNPDHVKNICKNDEVINKLRRLIKEREGKEEPDEEAIYGNIMHENLDNEGPIYDNQNLIKPRLPPPYTKPKQKNLLPVATDQLFVAEQKPKFKQQFKIADHNSEQSKNPPVPISKNNNLIENEFQAKSKFTFDTEEKPKFTQFYRKGSDDTKQMKKPTASSLTDNDFHKISIKDIRQNLNLENRLYLLPGRAGAVQANQKRFPIPPLEVSPIDLLPPEQLSAEEVFDDDDDGYISPNKVEAEENIYEPEPFVQMAKKKAGNVPHRLTVELPDSHSPRARESIQTLPLPLAPPKLKPKAVNSNMPNLKHLPRPPKTIPQLNDLMLPPQDDQGSINQSHPFYRYIDRTGAELLLTEELGDGAYLFRQNEKFFATLSVRAGLKIYHIGIEKVHEYLECISSGERVPFDSLASISEHFKRNPLTMIGKNNQLITIFLKDVLPRDWH